MCRRRWRGAPEAGCELSPATGPGTDRRTDPALCQPDVSARRGDTGSCRLTDPRDIRPDPQPPLTPASSDGVVLTRRTISDRWAIFGLKARSLIEPGAIMDEPYRIIRKLITGED